MKLTRRTMLSNIYTKTAADNSSFYVCVCGLYSGQEVRDTHLNNTRIKVLIFFCGEKEGERKKDTSLDK